MTNTWKPGSVKIDARGNIVLIAYNSDEMGIQRRDLDALIEKLTDVRDRFKSMHPIGRSLPLPDVITMPDDDDDPDKTRG